MFDVTNEKSFESLEHWHRELTMQAEPNIKIILIGNKVDLPYRRIENETAEKWAASRNIKYFETSAIINQNVEQSFHMLLQGRPR